MFKLPNLTINKFHLIIYSIVRGKSLTVRKCNIRFAVDAGIRVKAGDGLLIHRIASNITFRINLFKNLFASDDLRNPGKRSYGCQHL